MKIIKKTLKLFQLISIIIILFCLLLFLPILFGIKPYIVWSGSMEPVIKTGSIAYINERDISNINVGDIVTYNLNENKVTHRIVEITDNNIITKGDANETNDFSPISKDQIQGKYIFSIPFVGYILNFLQTAIGKSIILCLIAILIFTLFI